jgi:RNA polymerase sigma factor (sigma-70 family)
MAAATDRDVLIQTHLPLARAMARKWLGMGIPLEDLAQEAALGLCRAAEAFDPAKGPFWAFAHSYVRGYLLAAVNSHDAGLQVPARIGKARAKVVNGINRLLAQGDHYPTVQEVCKLTGQPAELVSRFLDRPREGIDLDDLGMLDPDPCPERDAMLDLVWDALSLCDQVERAVVIRLFGLDREVPIPKAQIAREMGMDTREVSKALTSALCLIARQLHEHGHDASTWLEAIS